MIVFEVGCHDGKDTVKWLDQGATVYGFEPHPRMIKILRKSLLKQYKNFHLIEQAVDIEENEKDFYLSGGCSSLHQFTENLDKLWPERTSWSVKGTTKIKTLRLDNFMESQNINHIDYLWIDAQGNDFRVLQSLGNKISLVKEGRCEAAYTLNLYKNTINDVNTISDWLRSNNFEVEIIPDEWNKEAD